MKSEMNQRELMNEAYKDVQKESGSLPLAGERINKSIYTLQESPLDINVCMYVCMYVCM